jgi:hypothetical protein
MVADAGRHATWAANGLGDEEIALDHDRIFQSELADEHRQHVDHAHDQIHCDREERGMGTRWYHQEEEILPGGRNPWDTQVVCHKGSPAWHDCPAGEVASEESDLTPA